MTPLTEGQGHWVLRTLGPDVDRSDPKDVARERLRLSLADSESRRRVERLRSGPQPVEGSTARAIPQTADEFLAMAERCGINTDGLQVAQEDRQPAASEADLWLAEAAKRGVDVSGFRLDESKR
jgi:hypothetical protein